MVVLYMLSVEWLYGHNLNSSNGCSVTSAIPRMVVLYLLSVEWLYGHNLNSSNGCSVASAIPRMVVVSTTR
jgi:hypothetical protein